MRTFSREDLAWAAGIFDGEGNAGGGLRRRHRWICASIAQAHQELPDRFCRVVSVGSVKGPYRPKYPNGLPYWVWTANQLETVQHVAAVLWPWLGSVKRDQLARAITGYRGAVPEYLLCPHGIPSRSCQPCRREWTLKGWESRSRYHPNAERDARIAMAFQDGSSRQEIARRFGIGYERVCQVIRQQARKEGDL